jgi:orotate phosphoribosyltransferase
VRKQAKDHGTKKLVEGEDVAGKRVVLVEDLVTTGGSSLAAVNALREAGAEVNDVLVIVTYAFPESEQAFKEAGIVLHPLVSFDAILEEALTEGKIGVEEVDVVRSWMRDPHSWDDR